MAHELAAAFRWRTMEGEVLTLAEMSTRHIFNSMKMVFNHLAEAHGGTPVWFNHVYTDYRRLARSQKARKLARTVLVFAQEIERRGDLPERYQAPYALIWNQVAGVRELPAPKGGHEADAWGDS